MPRWRRGSETATLLSPRVANIYVMGLMHSVNTSAPVEADVIVVRTFDELERRRDEVSNIR